MIEVGRLCVKIAGRDAGKKCVIVEVLDDNTVMIEGETRRRKCNIKHIEPLKETVDVKKGASRADVASAFKKLKIELKETKPKKASERPRQQRKVKVVEPEGKKKPAKKAEPKKEAKAEPKVEAKKEEPKPEVKETPKAEAKPVEKKE